MLSSQNSLCLLLFSLSPQALLLPEHFLLLLQLHPVLLKRVDGGRLIGGRCLARQAGGWGGMSGGNSRGACCLGRVLKHWPRAAYGLVGRACQVKRLFALSFILLGHNRVSFWRRHRGRFLFLLVIQDVRWVRIIVAKKELGTFGHAWLQGFCWIIITIAVITTFIIIIIIIVIVIIILEGLRCVWFFVD